MAKNPEFHKLLEPFHIGKVKTRNRIIKAASGTSFWNPGEHRITEKGKAFYESLAKGGVGLIIVESPIVEYPFDEPGDVRLRIDDDRHIKELREVTIAEIAELRDFFVRAVCRLKKAGFDGIELNAGCDHLFATFLSRYWNKRQDVYGCASMENRSRFLVQTIQEIKKSLGEDFPVIILINALEFGMGDQGMTYDESKTLAQILEKIGRAHV